MSAKAKNMKMFDTVTGSNKGAEIELHTIEGEPSGVKWSLLGPDSDEAIKTDKANRHRNFQLHNKQKSNQIDDTRDEIEKLVAVSTGWSGMPGDDGKERPFSKDAAREILTSYPAIRRELIEEHNLARNFIKA
jgi:hypothetical protein